MTTRPPSRLLLAAALATLAACAGRGPVMTSGAVAPAGVSERAMRVYRAAHVIDTHNDMPSKMDEDGYRADERHPAGFDSPRQGHTDLPRLLESGLTAVFMSAFVDAPFQRTRPDSSFERALVLVDTIRQWSTRHPDRLVFATTATDVRRAKREGKVAILVGVEGGHAIEGSLDNLRELHRRGARYLTLTWNNGNEWAGSNAGLGGTRTGGLTPFGRQVIAEMNRLGMFVDISHVSDSTFFDAVAASTAPVIASHSSARALNEHLRNLTDEQLRLVARNGGVVNVNFFSRFIDSAHFNAFRRAELELQRVSAEARERLGPDTASANAEIRRARARLFAGMPATPLSVLIDHVAHIARVAGVDHVGLGSDFDGVSALPVGMDDVTALPRIAQALLDRGWSEGDVQKVLGGNMLRVMERVLK